MKTATNSKRIINTPVVPPKESNAYAWYKDDDNTKALNPFGSAVCMLRVLPITYIAVPADTKIKVTVNPQPYEFADGTSEPKELNIDIANGIIAGDYQLKNADNIGWNIKAVNNTSVNDLIRGKYEFGYLDEYVLTPMELDTMTLRVATIDREWVDFGTIKGIKGNKLTNSDIISLEEYINENYDKLAEIIGFEPMLGTSSDYTKQFDTSTAVWGAFSTDSTQIKSSVTKAAAFGTDSAIYLNTMIPFTYQMYVTKTEGNKVVYDDKGTFGKAWNLVNTKTAVISSIGTKDNQGNTIYPYYTDTTHPVINVTTSEIDDVIKDIDKYNFTYTYKSGNGKEIKIDRDIVLFGRVPDCTEGLDNTIEFYIDLNEREYVLSAACSAAENEKFDKNASPRDSQIKLRFGDTISIDSFEFDGFTVKDMMEDGSVVNNVGYRLKRIYLNDIDLTAGDTVKIDADFIDNADYKGKLVFLTEWEAVPNKFTVYYQNSNKEWNILIEKVFLGNEDITADKIYNDVLKQTVINDCHESVVPVFDRILAQPGAASSVSVKASEGPMNLYVAYKATERYIFTDYNNDKETEKRFTCSAKLYGTQLYDPNLEGVATTSSPFINYFEVSVAPSSIPDKRQDVDKVTGEPLYEYLYETVLDEQGNPVIDPVTGKEKRQVVLDEFGYKVYDKTKPVYVDKKGDESEHRPYRNCEYIGYKVFYVDGVYTNAADLPAESEWKEGYNSIGGDDYGIYGTVIVQYQWKSDKDFLFRVYDANGKIFSALGKNLKCKLCTGRERRRFCSSSRIQLHG